MNKKYLQGRRKEREIKIALQECDLHVTRSSGSKGSYDLIAGKGKLTLAIQCKGQSVTKQERVKLISSSLHWSVPHIMVWKKDGQWMAEAYVDGEQSNELKLIFIDLLERGLNEVRSKLRRSRETPREPHEGAAR